MRAPRRLLAAVVEAAPFAILVVDAAGRIKFANRGAELLFGYRRDALLGLNVDALVPDATRARHHRHREQFARHPVERPMASGKSLMARRADGIEVSVEVALKPISSFSSRVLAVVVDTTERRRLEQRVVEAHEQLERRIEERTAQLAQTTAEKEGLLQDLQAKSRELERLSLEDPLTGLSNRRDLDRKLAECIADAQRTSRPLAVALFDIDHFKRVNDRYGHAAGDAVLRKTGELLRNECRAPDVVARYGGEEFALVLRDDTDAGVAICERIRSGYERADWSWCAPELALTISAGVAAWRPGMHAQALLDLADRALYEAKRGGRNRVVAAGRQADPARVMLAQD